MPSLFDASLLTGGPLFIESGPFFARGMSAIHELDAIRPVLGHLVNYGHLR